MLGFIILNRVLSKSHEAVADARQHQCWNEHLRQGTTEARPAKNARCLPATHWESNAHALIKVWRAVLNQATTSTFCLCHRRLLPAGFKRRQTTCKVSLCWDCEMYFMVIMSPKLVDMLTSLSLRINHLWPLIEPNGSPKKDWSHHEDASSLVVITTKGCYVAHVLEMFVKRICQEDQSAGLCEKGEH